MSLKYQLTILSATAEEVESARGAFAPGDAARLRLFRELAAELEATRLVSEGHPRALRWTLSASGHATVDLPPEEVLDQYFLRLRPFILKKESTYFPDIRSVLFVEIESAIVRQRLEQWKRQFTGEMTRSTYRLNIGNEAINSERMLNVWLNGSVYHHFDEKRAELAAVYKVVPEPICRFFFFDLMLDKGAAVLATARFINQMLEAPSASQ